MNPGPHIRKEEMRLIRIPADDSLPVHVVELEVPAGFERVSLNSLHDAFADTDGTVVMAVEEEFRFNHKPYNFRASVLYAPHQQHNQYYIGGDAFIVGEDMTPDGPDFVDVPIRIGSADIDDVIERYKNR